MATYSQKDDNSYESYTRLSQIDCCVRWSYTNDKRHLENLLQKTKNIDYQIPAKGKFVLDTNEKLIGKTALHLACDDYSHENDIGKCESIQSLLNYNADTTIKDAFGLTPLLGLVIQCTGDDWMREGSFSCGCVSRLLSAQVASNKHENPCNHHDFSHFHIACMANHLAAVEFFLKYGVDVNQTMSIDSRIFPGYSPLHFAVISCERETIEILLESGADLLLKNSDGLTPVQLLLKYNVDRFNRLDTHKKSDEPDREVLLSDIEMNEEIIDLFLKNERIFKLNVLDDFGLSVLHLASILKNKSLIEQLLMDDAVNVNQVIDVNSPICPGFTPLHLASMFNLDVAMILLKNGADPTIKDINGQSPLDICLKKCSIEEIHDILSTQSAWKNILMSDGKTNLLDLVHSMRDHTIFDLLVDDLQAREQRDLYVPIDAPLWPGYVPLHLAVIFAERADIEFCKSQYSSVNDLQSEVEVDLSIVEKCLKWNPKAVIAQDALGTTPLHLGFIYRKIRVTKILIPHSGHENPVDGDNLSHFHIACAENDRAGVESLMVNADINTRVGSNYTWFFCSSNDSASELHEFRIKSGYTPLHILVSSGNYPVAKMLIERGADINVTDDNGATPIHMLFHMCLSYNQLGELTKVFWSHPDLKDIVTKHTGISHLHIAITHDDIEAVERLLKLGANPNAAISNQQANLSRILEHHAGERPLQLTKLSYKNDAKIIDLLLRHGADISAVARDVELLRDILCKLKSTRNSALYLEENRTLQSRIRELTGLTMLHVACYLRDLDSVKSIIENNKADVNIQIHQDSSFWCGCTPLHFLILPTEAREFGNDAAVGEKIVSACKLLLENGANVALWNGHYSTPIHAAVAHSYPSKDISRALAVCARAMLDKYDNFSNNLVDRNGISLFHVACRMNAVRAAKKFLEKGVDVNEPIDRFLCDLDASEFAGFTPLHLCLTYQYSLRMIDLLLKYGANVHAENFKGDTPLHCAARLCRRRQKIFEKLIVAGADVNAQNVYSETPLEVALRAEKATPREIKFFCKRGYKPNYFNSTTQKGLISYIFKQGINTMRLTDAMLSAPGFCGPDEMGRTALHNMVACSKSELDCGEYLILIEKCTKRGCAVDFQNKSGRTALHYAALFSNAEAVSALLLAGADINIVDDENHTPYACALNPYEAIYDLDDEFRSSSNCESTIKILANHVHQFQLLNVYISQANAKIQQELVERGYWKDSCLKSYMKINNILEPYISYDEELTTIPIGNSSITLGDFLTDAGIVFAYPTMSLEDREAINKFFEDNSLSRLEDNFGEYVKFLNLQYKKALARKTLLQRAEVSLMIITQFLLPELFAHATVKLLSNDDLKNMIAVGDELNSSS